MGNGALPHGLSYRAHLRLYLFDPKWSFAFARKSGFSRIRFQHVPRCRSGVSGLAVRRRSGTILREDLDIMSGCAHEIYRDSRELSPENIREHRLRADISTHDAALTVWRLRCISTS
jgi:hypothetical protein